MMWRGNGKLGLSRLSCFASLFQPHYIMTGIFYILAVDKSFSFENLSTGWDGEGRDECASNAATVGLGHVNKGIVHLEGI